MHYSWQYLRQPGTIKGGMIMTDFKDYYGKVIQLNDRVLFADKDAIKEGEVTEIFGNYFFVKGDDGYNRSF